jgi:hypothetical protein
MNIKKHSMFSRGLVLAIVMMVALSFGSCGKETVEKPDEVEYPSNAVMVDQTTKMPVHIPSGDPAVADLDGAGKSEIIEFVLEPSDGPYPPVVSAFTINGKEYKDLLLDEFPLALDFPWDDGFYLVDLDKDDGMLEIAILDEGPSSDSSTYYFRYVEGELTYLGDIPDFPGSKTCIFNGDGTVTAQLRLNVLQTWWAPATWRLNELDRLQQESQTAYVPYEEWNKSALLEDLPLFLTKDQSSDTTIALKDSTITFVETDNIHWVKLKADGGVTGWFYLKDYSTVMVNGEPRETIEIFKDLLFAD